MVWGFCFLGEKCFMQGVSAFFAFIFPFKEISCKLQNCEMGCPKSLPFIRCFSSVNAKLNPVHTCSFLSPLRVRISSNDVITIRLLLKSLPNSAAICLLFTFSTTFGPKGRLTCYKGGPGIGTISQLCGYWCWSLAVGGVGGAGGWGGGSDYKNHWYDSDVNNWCIWRH